MFENKRAFSPKVSIILLDWSCRESFHMLDYFSRQTAPREKYEILWIEYYQRCSSTIGAKLEACKKTNSAPVVDQWIVLEMPEAIYYHKHLMYNIGILASRGEIVVLCDSDAMVKPTFVENIIKTFEKDPNIVLHMDEVKNESQRFYPFNDPSFEDVLGLGCINWKDGKTKGLLDGEDPLHSRNYGACMCALKTDILNIGGADEHRDYLGHICGPYELTFRLVNAGKREIWHEREFLYHVWHPGTNGRKNYLGPHDGSNMSMTALKIRRSGRTMPLVENPEIRRLRLGADVSSQESVLSRAVSNAKENHWKITAWEQRYSEFVSMTRRIKRKLVKTLKFEKKTCLPL